MNKQTLAKQGRHGDTRLAHLTPGEMVVPKSLKPEALGLLAPLFEAHGKDLARYTVGPDASKNPKTGLLEFFSVGGDNDGDSTGGESQGGRGRGGFSAKGGVTGGRDVGGNGDSDGLAAGREMMGMNTSPLGYGRFTGETVAGTLSRMANQMKEGGYRNVGISDTMKDMGVGFGQRAKTIGFGPAMGSFGRSVLNTGGGIIGGLAGGVPGAIAGGLLGDVVTGEGEDVGRQFARNVVGTLVGGITQGAGPAASMAANALSKYAMRDAFNNPGPAQRNERTPGSIGGLIALNAASPQTTQAMQIAQAPGIYNANAVVNPVQFANVYDPLRNLRMRGLL